MTQHHNILPCPFCAGTNTRLVQIGACAYVRCDAPKCDVFGPSGSTALEAITRWNSAAEALIRTNDAHSAAYQLGYARGVADMGDHAARVGTKAAAYLLLAETPPDPTTILPRARDIADRVYDLNLLDATHPGMLSQEDVREKRGRLIAEIGRLMGGAS